MLSVVLVVSSANEARAARATNAATAIETSPRATLFLPAVERDIVDIHVAPGARTRRTECDDVERFQIHVRRAFSEPDLREIFKGYCVEFPIGREFDGSLPSILAPAVAIGRRRIVLVP